MVAQKTHAQHRQCQQLEQELKNVSREKTFWDPAVKNIRLQLRESYETLLLEDYSFAQTVDCEQLLWKYVFYKPIEEFRRRLWQTSQQGGSNRELQAKAASAFRKFLEDSQQFYRLLALKLQREYGDVGLKLFPHEEDLIAAVACNPQADVDCRASVYRCLVCLGDLARYEAPLLADKSNNDWSKAAAFYKEAVRVFPEGGNSYNQLAVLETHETNEFGAVYYYFRALSVQVPFLIARENLILLFEQNRQRYEAIKGATASHRGSSTLLSDMAIRFVRVQGLLFTKIDLDNFIHVSTAAFADLKALLRDVAGVKAHLGKQASGRSKSQPAPDLLSIMLQRIVVLAIFSTHNIYFVRDGHKPVYSEILQRSELRRLALSVLYSLGAQLCEAACSLAATAGASDVGCVLAPLNVLLQWLATHQEFVSVSEPNPTEMKARKNFWSAAAKVVEEAGKQVEEAGLTAEHSADVALPEEFELRGFNPLEDALKHLRFEDGVPAPQEAGSIRWLHVLSACKALLAVLHQPNVGGSHPTSGTAPFLAAMEALAAPKAATEGSLESADKDTNGHDHSVAQDNADEEEEVIVFSATKAPQRQAAQQSAPGPAFTAPPIPTATLLTPAHLLPVPASTSNQTTEAPRPVPPTGSIPVLTPLPPDTVQLTTTRPTPAPVPAPASAQAHLPLPTPGAIPTPVPVPSIQPHAKPLQPSGTPIPTHVTAPNATSQASMQPQPTGQASLYADAARAPSPSQLPAGSLFCSTLFGRDLFADARVAHFEDVSRQLPLDPYGLQAVGQQAGLSASLGYPGSLSYNALPPGTFPTTLPGTSTYAQFGDINRQYVNSLGGTSYGTIPTISQSSLFGTLFPPDVSMGGGYSDLSGAAVGATSGWSGLGVVPGAGGYGDVSANLGRVTGGGGGYEGLSAAMLAAAGGLNGGVSNGNGGLGNGLGALVGGMGGYGTFACAAVETGDGYGGGLSNDLPAGSAMVSRPELAADRVVSAAAPVPRTGPVNSGMGGGFGWLDAFAASEPAADGNSTLPFPGMSTTPKAGRRTFNTDNPFVP